MSRSAAVPRPAWVLDHAPDTPFMSLRTRDAPGISPLDPANWLARDADFDAQTAYRKHLIARHRDKVIAAVPEAADAISELGDRLGLPGGADVLADSAAIAAEDFCIMAPGPDGYRLVGATLCFPAHWVLAEKLGRPMEAIHDPVPDYDPTMARRVGRMFDTLHVDRPLMRANWLIDPTPELFLPGGTHADRETSDGTGPLYLRTERQTMIRLPETGSIVFGIKTSISDLDALPDDQIAALADGIRAYSAGKVAYRGGERWHAAMLGRLDRMMSARGIVTA